MNNKIRKPLRRFENKKIINIILYMVEQYSKQNSGILKIQPIV